MENQEQISLGKYHLTNFANGIKKITNSTPMVSIVNAFIAMMPIIIAASIFTLLAALPEMVIKVTDSALSTESGWADWLKANPGFGEYQTWAAVISNWSMGLLGMLVTAMIARNMGEQLNNKLPMARKMNLNTIFIAGISCYLMLSVIEFTVSADNSWAAFDHTGRAIFVDGLAAQGILPGIIIGLTLPYVFYFAYKHNWTIRLPKQVPQTISQAFLGVIPLFLVLAIYGSIAFGLNKVCGMPVLFWMFTKIQEGFTSNPNINDSYGLIAAYSLMESGFWYLGVHPEPVHAVMRATFWFANSAEGGHIFTEPLMYGFGAMGGSGTTLMVPMLCLLMCHSTKMRVTGKTAAVPILFQVNEPALFGVPLILNPIFAFPFILTGLINNELFALLAKTTSFQGGTLYLPWSTPYFLQTTLGTPTQWQPWVFCFVALAVCSITYAPFIKIQDNIYLKEEMRSLGLEAVN
ncbi:MAG: PTS sugar transporter subunit IIC, partial [Malacoplasma sp.]|nr:PTS sugar transporter subunit IIC [Malacoplasma sp.]